MLPARSCKESYVKKYRFFQRPAGQWGEIGAAGPERGSHPRQRRVSLRRRLADAVQPPSLLRARPPPPTLILQGQRRLTPLFFAPAQARASSSQLRCHTLSLSLGLVHKRRHWYLEIYERPYCDPEHWGRPFVSEVARKVQMFPFPMKFPVTTLWMRFDSRLQCHCFALPGIPISTLSLCFFLPLSSSQSLSSCASDSHISRKQL